MSIMIGDCLEVMKGMEDNSISSIVTDPPYGLKFMGKDWDHGIPGIPYWEEALRISKPGSFLLAFGGTRTYHRLACAIEDAGWEIRDCIQWLYGSGFPKSHNHFGIEGYGTALKPAYEPIIMAMKPCDGTFANNAEKWGQAGINIDESRIKTQESWIRDRRFDPSDARLWKGKKKIFQQSPTQGRWPANVILDGEAGEQLDEQSGFNPSRFFYCSKASPSERNRGLEHLEDKVGGGLNATVKGDTRTGHITLQKNNHPTVKPLKLMQYLIKLVMPPKDGVLLDPFAGSGSTILAAQKVGVKAIGIEKNEEYAEIARNRLGWNGEEENVACV